MNGNGGSIQINGKREKVYKNDRVLEKHCNWYTVMYADDNSIHVYETDNIIHAANIVQVVHTWAITNHS